MERVEYMKRVIILFLSALILFTGCVNRKPTILDGEYKEDTPTGPSVEEESLPESEIRTDLLKRAMLNDKKVNNSGSYRMLKEFQENIDGFYVVDVDHDEVNEVILVDGEQYYSLDIIMDTVNYEKVLIYTDGVMLNQKGYWQYEEIEDGILQYLLIEEGFNDLRIVFDMGVCTLDNVSVPEEGIELLITDYYSGWATYYEYTEDNINKYISSETKTIENNQITLAQKEIIDNCDEELNLMQRVLLDLEEFIDTEDNKLKKLSDLDNYSYYHYFSVVDYNNDNIEEFVTNAVGDRKIFYEINGRIYMFDWGYRNMSNIYVDGAFEYNPDTYYRITEFTPEGAVMEEISDYTPTKTIDEYIFSRYNIINVLSDWK